MIDNIIVGNPVVSNELLGIIPTEVNHISNERFLPRLLVDAGICKSTSQVKQINKIRLQSTKITDPQEKNLWRTLDQLEFTRFKIGKHIFWLVVGE